jgi:thioredoxin reductase (NADPH)
MKKEILDCAIIGGGPAGLTAGLYTTRGGLENVVMFEKGMPGGQITSSSEIENYPGVVGEITGMELMDPWLEQCTQFGLKHEMVEVKKITKDNDLFQIIKEDGSVVEAHSVIVGTGSTPRLAGFQDEKDFIGKGISYCATCDGFFYKNKEVIVVGGGDTALEEALYLSKLCSKVTIIHRRDKFRSSPNTITRVEKTDNIELLMETSVVKVLGDLTGVTGVIIKDNSGVETELNAPGVFVFVGNDINNEVLVQEAGKKIYLCKVNGSGQVTVNLKMETSVAGLYAVGDMREDAPKQVISAAGDGSVAALSAIHYVDKKLN